MHAYKFMQNYDNNFLVKTFNILNYLMPPHDKSKLCAPILLKRSYIHLSISISVFNYCRSTVSIAICAQVPWISLVSIHLSVLNHARSIFNLYISISVLKYSESLYPPLCAQACTVYLSKYISLCSQVPWNSLSTTLCSRMHRVSIYITFSAQVPCIYLSPFQCSSMVYTIYLSPSQC